MSSEINQVLDVISYLFGGKNIQPLMNTEPDKRMYQHVASSPVLKIEKLFQ